MAPSPARDSAQGTGLAPVPHCHLRSPGDRLGLGHTLLSPCLAVTVPRALPWAQRAHLASVLWPQPLVTAPGVTRLTLLGDSPGDITGASTAPAVPREDVALGDTPGPDLSLRWQNSGGCARSSCSGQQSLTCLRLPRAVSCAWVR